MRVRRQCAGWLGECVTPLASRSLSLLLKAPQASQLLTCSLNLLHKTKLQAAGGECWCWTPS